MSPAAPAAVLEAAPVAVFQAAGPIERVLQHRQPYFKQREQLNESRKAGSRIARSWSSNSTMNPAAPAAVLQAMVQLRDISMGTRERRSPQPKYPVNHQLPYINTSFSLLLH